MFFMDFVIVFLCLFKASGAVFLYFCCPGNRLKNGWIFGVALDAKFTGAGGKSRGILGL